MKHSMSIATLIPILLAGCGDTETPQNQLTHSSPVTVISSAAASDTMASATVAGQTFTIPYNHQCNAVGNSAFGLLFSENSDLETPPSLHAIGFQDEGRVTLIAPDGRRFFYKGKLQRDGKRFSYSGIMEEHSGQTDGNVVGEVQGSFQAQC